MTNGGATGEELFGPEFDVYRALVEGIPAILYIDSLDEWSTNWYTSPQAERLLGFTVEEWGTTPDLWLQRIHPDDRDRVKDENDRSNESRRTVHVRAPLQHEGRAHGVAARRGAGRHQRRRAAVLARIHARHHGPEEAEEKLPVEPRVLRRTIQQRRELALRLESAQEEERRRIAADIHDDPIQVMSAVDLRMGMMVERDEPVDPAPIATLQETVRQSIERLRSLLFELRPAALDRRRAGRRPHAVPAAHLEGNGVDVRDRGSSRVRARSRAPGHALPHGAGGGGQRPEALVRLARGGHGDHGG